MAMVKRISGIAMFVVASCSMGLSSCARKEGPNTPFTKLVGTWKKVQFATDDNNNGQIDAWEISAVQPNITNTIEFRKDNTGVEKTSFSPDLDFKWSVVGDVSVLLTYNANDTLLYRLVSVTSSTLEMTTRGNISLAGYYYDRQ